ncbi:UEV domain-containing protein [Dipodascopsis uninucleata]
MSRQVPQQTIEWLHRVLLQEYSDVNRTFSDVVQCLQLYHSIAPRTEVYTYETGKSELLLNLHGTLPARFHGNIYNIPVSIWVPHEYPYLAPIAYVTPTAQMGLRAGNHVDSSGKIYHPFISYWNGQNPQTNLLELCRVLSDIFGQEPPVYGKPPPGPNYLQQQLLQPSQPAPTPPPAIIGQAQPLVNFTRNNDIHQQVPAYSTLPSSPQHHIGKQNQQPQDNLISFDNNITALHNTAAPSYNASAYSTQQAPYLDFGDRSMTPRQMAASQPPSGIGTSSVSLYASPEKQQSLSNLQHASVRDIIDETPSISPVSSTPVPHLPPHPEQVRLTNEILAILNKKAAEARPGYDKEVEQLKHTLEMLKLADSNLNKEESELKKIIANSSNNRKLIEERIKTADRTISDARQAGDVNIDDIICAEAAVFNQIYDLMADDLAIEDTIYILGKALDRERIGVEVFLKHTRTLAREQFMKRALVGKIASLTGLSER